VYEALYAAAEEEPLNLTPVSEGYTKYLKYVINRSPSMKNIYIYIYIYIFHIYGNVYVYRCITYLNYVIYRSPSIKTD
jgi:hypothetical protein